MEFVVIPKNVVGFLCLLYIFFLSNFVLSDYHQRERKNNDLMLFIDKDFVKKFSNFPMQIFAILDGHVLPYILDRNFERYLPVIPNEVTAVNFTFKAGDSKKYFYDFHELKSYNLSILANPIISIDTKGKVPRRAKVFSVLLSCNGNISGLASFSIGLTIKNEKGDYLSGTPLRVKLKKQCAFNHGGPDPECDKKCANGGRCNAEKICVCYEGYMGKYCHSALCYPKCMNGGTCVAPGLCGCPEGFIGRHCEGGMCPQACLNSGKCINKDLCLCPRGYYGPRCEYSKCKNVPCLNGGQCIGINRCRCRRQYTGRQCESLIDSFAHRNSGGKPRHRRQKKLKQ